MRNLAKKVLGFHRKMIHKTRDEALAKARYFFIHFIDIIFRRKPKNFHPPVTRSMTQRLTSSSM